MGILGIGPILAMVGGGAAVVVIALGFAFDLTLPVSSTWYPYLRLCGILLVSTGVFFWISAGILIKRAFERRLFVTLGVFRISRNPMYAGFIVFIIPGIAFIVNNLVILLISVVMFLAFKVRIGLEESYLRQEFGERFTRYEQEVAQLIPFVRV
jgi:protein-S-isoprenylcysteine O-methyltransferase Ste14